MNIPYRLIVSVDPLLGLLPSEIYFFEGGSIFSCPHVLKLMDLRFFTYSDSSPFIRVMFAETAKVLDLSPRMARQVLTKKVESTVLEVESSVMFGFEFLGVDGKEDLWGEGLFLSPKFPRQANPKSKYHYKFDASGVMFDWRSAKTGHWF